MAFTHLFILSLALYHVTAKVKLSELVPLCSKQDPQFFECAKKSGQLFISQMVKGIKDYGIPPVDPLKIPFLELSQSEKPVGLKLNISDTIHEGIGKAQIEKIVLDNDKDHLEVDIHAPLYTIAGTCDVGGRILLLPITGHGPCKLSAYDFKVKLTLEGTKEQRNGKLYVKSKKYDVKIKFTKGKFELKGLFGGNKELSDTMSRFLNENALDVLNEMKPTLEIVWSQIFGGLIDRLINSVPNDELFAP